MLRPDLFRGFASHAGGGLFEVSIRPFFRSRRRRCATLYDGSIERFLDDFRTGPARRRTARHAPPAPVGLLGGVLGRPGRHDPASLRHATAEVIPELWERWLEWDYPTLVPRHADALRGLRAIYIDVGTRDEWFLDLDREWLGGS